MKRYAPLCLAIQLVLTSCASTTGSGSNQSGSDDSTFKTVGAAVSVLLGLITTKQTGNASQGESVMTQAMNVFNSTAPHSSTSLSENSGVPIETAIAQLEPTAAGGSGSSSGSVQVASFDPAKYMPGSGCEKNLSYLASRLPRQQPKEINDIRDGILSEDMNTAMLKINSMGLTPDAAIQQALQQAEEFDKTAIEALSTASQVDAFGTTDEAFERDIKAGKVVVTECDGIRNSSLCAAIFNKYGAIASRATAANLMCYKKTNQWPH